MLSEQDTTWPERRIRGWLVSRRFPSGMYRAEKIGRLPLAADTLGGMRSLIRHIENGGRR